jgi:hypothetical protein
MNGAIMIGRLLRAGTRGFVVGCRVSQLENPSFGGLVKAPVSEDYQIFGLIHDIHIDDDGLVRQLVTAEGVAESVINDNRLNRNVPLEMSVLSIGYRQGGQIWHTLPPRPPLSLDIIYLCGLEEVREFSSAGRFGYFRHVLEADDLPTSELIASHLRQASQAHIQFGDSKWLGEATQELITLLRDDYPVLMNVLGALSDIYPR